MKKQIGNDVRLEWTILRKGVAEDFTDATDLLLTAFIPNLSVDEVIIPIARVGNVFTLNIPTTDLAIGTYTIRLQYKKPDPAFVSGKASISTAVNGAFQVVPIGANEDDLNDELTSNVVYCTDGATFIPSVFLINGEAILSWTNDKGYVNPDPVNIKGNTGESVYDYYLANTTDNPPLTESEYAAKVTELPTTIEDAIDATSAAAGAASVAINAASSANNAASNANNAATAANAAAQEVENLLQNIQTLPTATLYLNAGNTLTPEAPSVDVVNSISLVGTTPTIVNFIYTAPTDGFVSFRSTYSPAFYVRNLNTISTYSVTLAWFIGATKIVEASQSVKPSGPNVLFTFPMTNNLLTANIDYLAGQVFTLRATISKDGVPNQTIEVYSANGQRSGFTRNGGAIGSGEIVDFNGTNTQTQAQRNRSYEDKLTSFEQTPELATTKTTGFYYGGTTTTLSPFASFTAINLISVKQGDVLVIQGMSAATLALGFQGCEFNAANNKVKEIKAADFVAITGGYKLTIATSTATQLGLHCVNADAATFSVKRGSTVAETLAWKLKSTSLPPIPDFISQLTKIAVNDEMIGIGKKARFIAGVIRTYAHIPFDNGSRLPVANEVLVGATSGKSYTVLSVKLDSGSWASGTAVGHIVIDARANYLSNPYTDLENLQIGGITVARRSSVAVFGGWEQIGGSHESIGILNYSTGTSQTTINFTFVATKIVSMVACPDEGFAGYTMGLSVGSDKAYLRVQKLVASTSTGAISGVIQDYSNLANCINDDNIWLFGIMLI